MLVVIRVIARRVQDTDTHQPARVHVGVPHFAEEAHAGRRERVVLGELQLGGEDAALEGRALRALDERFPGEQVVFGDGAGGYAFGGVVG